MTNKEEEFWYIDFDLEEICSWIDEGNERDKANKLINNNFKSFLEAKKAVEKIWKSTQL